MASMNHLVFLDARAGELEKILSGVKRMLVKDIDPRQVEALPVAPGDGLYFLRDSQDRTVRVRATVARVLLLTGAPEEDLSQALKERQPRLQLTEEQYSHWSARPQALLVEFDAAHKADVIHVAPSRMPDSSGWLVFEDLHEITGEEAAYEGRIGTTQPGERHPHARRKGGSHHERQDRS
jgi:hypothetical protein